eukprot:CAMPEP_0171294930 /NCGR_PEP_ID=MMETSP0816-20121228/3459_1 /TAXON_ID=420281 /ORGANISM="Proboscia inermis, Strain CCAP1064/1" /LENGTH=137 /DNA_ID=CAMNT_0011767157 /DNA_START=542 /DNA_END=952 /DNA_ORIENTATION=-
MCLSNQKNTQSIVHDHLFLRRSARFSLLSFNASSSPLPLLSLVSFSSEDAPFFALYVVYPHQRGMLAKPQNNRSLNKAVPNCRNTTKPSISNDSPPGSGSDFEAPSLYTYELLVLVVELFFLDLSATALSSNIPAYE